MVTKLILHINHYNHHHQFLENLQTVWCCYITSSPFPKTCSTPLEGRPTKKNNLKKLKKWRSSKKQRLGNQLNGVCKQLTLLKKVKNHTALSISNQLMFCLRETHPTPSPFDIFSSITAHIKQYLMPTMANIKYQ